MKTETIERIHKLLKESADRLNVRVIESVCLCGKEVSDALLEDCKNAQIHKIGWLPFWFGGKFNKRLIQKITRQSARKIRKLMEEPI